METVWVFTVFAVAANLAFVWPQALRILRRRDLAGVSPGTWTISVVLFTVWASYALTAEFWALMLANLSCLVAAVLILGAGTSRGWPRHWAGIAALGVVGAGIAALTAPLLLAAVMTGAGVALRVRSCEHSCGAPMSLGSLRRPGSSVG